MRSLRYPLAALAVALLFGLLLLVAILGNSNTEGCGVGAQPSSTAQHAIPSDLVPVFQAAESKYGIPWTVLAAINSVETDFGRLKAAGVTSGANSAGAMGPMQFLAGTFATYGVDGDHDGRKDIYSEADAIPSAAKYLKASGGAKNLKQAIFAYNHADWYVDEVLALAKKYSNGGAIVAAATTGCDSDAAVGDASAQAIYHAADELDGMHVPYNYGGGHVTPARPTPGSEGPFNGMDCSAAVSWVLQHGGLHVATMTSGAYESWGRPGAGNSVTLYANPGHIIMSIQTSKGPRFFGTSGFGHPAAGTGAAWFTKAPGAGYLAGFVKRHPPGL